jgi:DNA-binding response OmpR family regulator
MKKILLVEENPKYQQSQLSVLQKIPRTQVLMATNGRAAYKILEKENPEILIFDTQFKDGSVNKLVKAFLKRRDGAQAILVRGKDQVKASQMGTEDNLDKLLQNPYHPAPLLFSIKQSLNYLSLVDVAPDPADLCSNNLN